MQAEEETHEMKVDTTEQETLDELVTWYRERYTRQMVSGSNIKPERMEQNLAVLQDAVFAYRTWKGHPAAIDTVLLRPDPPPPGDGRLSQLEEAPAGELERIRERGGAVERPYQIDIDARHSVIHPPEEKPARRATCGNCGVKYEITDDPEENHHRAMRHKLTCGKGDVDQYSEPQRAALLDDFHNQPMQRLFAERAAAELAAGADPARLKLTGVSIFGDAPQPARPEIAAAPDPELYPGTVDQLIEACTAPRRWWQFWRWFERSAD